MVRPDFQLGKVIEHFLLVLLDEGVYSDVLVVDGLLELLDGFVDIIGSLVL
jgi:hypothetical protein